ncbi:MAG TPA: helix-hairpin-helix domain-containing protein [Candidatus Limnocylindria bacterium]|nr:helix-hairpin-helix domain-containing protein [Candidatus Limnocylindria bacterium]
MTTPDRFLVAGAGAALITAALGIWLLVAPGDQPAFDPGTDSVAFAHDASASAVGSSRPSVNVPALLVIDVEGGVAHPGIVKLEAGSRVADAIIAAGGYGADADLLAASQINLAAILSDGQQVLVPIRNAGSPAGSTGQGGGSTGTGGPGGGPTGLLNLNQATPEQLDALPGIGPVTVQKIVAARQERPFASLDELVERKVLTGSQLEKIRDQVTAG